MMAVDGDEAMVFRMTGQRWRSAAPCRYVPRIQPRPRPGKMVGQGRGGERRGRTSGADNPMEPLEPLRVGGFSEIAPLSNGPDIPDAGCFQRSRCSDKLIFLRPTIRTGVRSDLQMANSCAGMLKVKPHRILHDIHAYAESIANGLERRTGKTRIRLLCSGPARPEGDRQYGNPCHPIGRCAATVILLAWHPTVRRSWQ